MGGGALGESRVRFPQFTALPLRRSPITPRGGCGPASEIAGEVLLHKIRILIESVTLTNRTMETPDLKTIVKVQGVSPRGEGKTDSFPAPTGQHRPGLSGEEEGAG